MIVMGMKKCYSFVWSIHDHVIEDPYVDFEE